MDGLHEMTAASVPIDIAGRTYLLAPLRAKDYGEIERRMLLDRPRPLDVVKAQLAGLSAEGQRHLLELAYRDERIGPRVTLAEMQAWLATVEGQVYRFWLMLRREQPELSLLDAEDLLHAAAMNEQEVTDAIETSLGLPLGKS